MPRLFEELDFCPTPHGDLSLRRRRIPPAMIDTYEIKLGEDFLMTSAFTASEIALADLALTALPERPLDIVVGGLGLGYTARAVLDHGAVATLTVVEYHQAVIAWHTSGLVPLGLGLTSDPRCRFVHGDFFALAAQPAGFDANQPRRTYDAILLDIDHSPEALLDPANAAFYGLDGLKRMATHLASDGVFALWSNDTPDATFTTRLACVFTHARAEPVRFHNPLQDRPFTQTVYIADSPITAR